MHVYLAEIDGLHNTFYLLFRALDLSLDVDDTSVFVPCL
jgi:hypothetical protein